MCTRGGSHQFLYSGVPTQPPNHYPFSYKIYEKDTLSLTKFAKTIIMIIDYWECVAFPTHRFCSPPPIA